jgi:hypothetical protein
MAKPKNGGNQCAERLSPFAHSGPKAEPLFIGEDFVSFALHGSGDLALTDEWHALAVRTLA